MSYAQVLVQKMTTPHRKISMCAVKVGSFGVSLDARMKICSVWDHQHPLVRHELHHWCCMAVSGQYIALANNIGDIHLYEHAKPPHEAPYIIDIDISNSGNEAADILSRRRQAVAHLSFSPDGNYLLMINKQRHVYAFCVADKTLLPALPQIDLVPFNYVAYNMYRKNVAACWSPDNQHILLIFNSKPLIHRLGTSTWGAAEPAAVPQDYLHLLHLCAWSPRADQTYALVRVGSVFGIWIYIYQQEEQEEQQQKLKLTIHITTRHHEYVSGLVYSTDGSLLAVGTPTAPFIHFFSPATGIMLFKYSPPPFFTNKVLGCHGAPPYIHISDNDHLHVAINHTCYTHKLVPRWKQTMMLMLLLKGQQRRRSLPHELWHLIACDFRDSLQVSCVAALPMVIYNKEP